MKLRELTTFLDAQIPLAFQENYDNSGLQIGDPEREITSALITLDVTDRVLEEAEEKDCDVIISHHPLIFGGLKNITGRSATEKILVRAIKKDIAIYSAHTNLDVLGNGVSRKMAGKLNLKNVKVLQPLRGKLSKLVTFVPASHFEKVRDTIFSAGGGVIGGYDSCSYSSPGEGTFRGGEETNPFAGEKGKLHTEKEIRLEVILYSHLKNGIIRALLKVHPYEEPAFDIYPLENDLLSAGLGCYGELSVPVEENRFLEILMNEFSAQGIRHSGFTGKMISKVALCGGAGGPLLNDAIASGADAFVSADIRYHSFFEAEGRLLLADIGHFESEKFSVEILYDLIIKKFPNFALRFSGTNTNPINYLHDGEK